MILTSGRTKALIAMLTLLVGALALCANRVHNGDVYLELFSGRFISQHGLVSHDPFPTIAQGQPWLNQQWLTELAFYRVSRAIGLTGLTILYAMLLAAPLGLLLWSLRRKGGAMLAMFTALFFPGLLAVLHPRAAGFTVLAFSLLVVLILAAWCPPAHDSDDAGRFRWALVGIPLLFALWANLHAGFVAGLLLIALVALGFAIDRWRGLPGALAANRVAIVGLTGILAAAAVMVTPLGSAIWSYVLSFRDPAISLGSKEWGSVLTSLPAVAYLVAAVGFAGWLWSRAPAPRSAMPLLVTAGFLAFAAFSLRNVIFVAPALALQIALTAPNRAAPALRAPIALAGSAAVGAVLVWVAVLGPARNEPHLGSPVVAYALDHPPRTGRIATYAGVGSYLLWRSPRTQVVIDGWLEHFSTADLRGNYGILRGWNGDPTQRVKDLKVGAVIAHLPVAIRALKAHGFVAKLAAPDGTYLVLDTHAGSARR